MFIEDLNSLYDNIAWTHKIHEKQADIDLIKGKYLQWISIILMAASSTGVLSSFAFDDGWIRIATSVAATLALFISIVREAKAYELASCAHSFYAKDYLSLKSELESSIANCNGTIEQIASTVECVRCKYNQLNNHAPRTGRIALWRAEKAHKNNELKLFLGQFESLRKN